MAASIIGFFGVGVLVLLAIWLKWFWLGLMSAFILINCWGGLRHALALARMAKLPRREGFACPSCKTAPPLGELWRCGKCGKPFDIFLTQATCPHCATKFNSMQCLDCGNTAPFAAWSTFSAESGVRGAE
jgi:DNA-directed RNA polymerase subunit RPC12/RpoP